MKVTFILPGTRLSGGTRVASIVASGLAKRGHRVKILCLDTNENLWEATKAKLRLIFGIRTWLEAFEGGISYFREITRCSFEKDEILVGVGMWASRQLGRLMALPNAKLQYLHGHTPWEPALMEETFKLPIPKVVVASYLQEMIESMGGQVLRVIPNGVNCGEYYPCTKESLRDGVGTIYASGWAKDPMTIIKVLKGIHERAPNLPIRVFSMDKKPQSLRHCIYRRFPSVEEARKMYSRSLVWIVASRSEGFSLPVLEAMACGAICIATDCGGPRDIIVDGKNGFLVPTGDVEKIVERALLVAQNDELRAEMKMAASETVKSFTWERCVSELEGVLELLRPWRRE